MSRQLATFSELPGVMPGLRRYRLDCRHGTTTADVVGDPGSSLTVLDVLIAKHWAEEGCRCAQTLRPPAPPQGAVA